MFSAISANFNALSGPSYAIGYLPQDVFRESRSCLGRAYARLPTALSASEISISIIRRVTGVFWKTLYGDARLNPFDLPMNDTTCAIGVALAGCVTLPNGIMEFNTAYRVHDGEGIRRSIAKLVVGVFVLLGSALSLATHVNDSVALYAAPFFLAGTVLSILSSSLNLYRSVEFFYNIKSSLGEKGEDYEAALEFLKGKIAPTQAEREKIEAECSEWETQENKRIIAEKVKEYLNQRNAAPATDEEDTALFAECSESVSSEKRRKIEEKLQALTDVKIQYLKRRTSSRAVEKLLEAIRLGIDAKTLISDFKKEVQMMISSAGFGLLISSIALTALILGTFFSMGTIPTALFLVSSGCSLLNIIYPIIEDMFFSSPKPPDSYAIIAQDLEQFSDNTISKGPYIDYKL